MTPEEHAQKIAARFYYAMTYDLGVQAAIATAIRAAVEEEREAIAKLCDGDLAACGNPDPGCLACRAVRDVAAAIRARGGS